MRSFDDIFNITAARKGGDDVLLQILNDQQPAALLKTDSAWLEQITKCVFQAGFNWKVINAKWDGFQTAFRAFDVNACAMMDDDWLDSLVSDASIVRNATKIRTVPLNAQFILDCQAEHGSFAKMIKDWPSDDYVGLLSFMKKYGSRLGGATSQYLLRFGGRDGFILSRDVTARLIAEGIVDKTPTSARAMNAVQDAFNTWQGQSDLSLTQMSRVLAMSID